MATPAFHSVQDHSLVQRAQQGDRAAFRLIVEAHQEKVYTIALGLARNHHDAEDLVQEVFLKAYSALGKFRGDAQLSSWLYRITLNAGLDARRRRASRPSESLEDCNRQLTLVDDDPAADPQRHAVACNIRSDIDRAVLRLSAAERSVFVLRHDGELKLKEIAATLGRAEGTVKNLLFRALRKLRKHLAHHQIQPGGAS